MRVLPLAALAAVVLAGCAQTSPPAPAVLPSASGSAVASVTSTPSASAAPSASPTPSSTVPTPSVSPKKLATLTLPTTFGTYQANTVAGTGEQQVVYVNPDEPKDVLNVAVTALASAQTIAGAYTDATVQGPATCGTVTSNSSTVVSCAMPLDQGAIVVTGSGAQTLDVVAAASAALWQALA